MKFSTPKTHSRASIAVQGCSQGCTSDVRVKGSRKARQGLRTTLYAAATPQAPSKGGQTPGLASLPAGEARGSGGKAPRQDNGNQTMGQSPNPGVHVAPPSRITAERI